MFSNSEQFKNIVTSKDEQFESLVRIMDSWPQKMVLIEFLADCTDAVEPIVLKTTVKRTYDENTGTESFRKDMRFLFDTPGFVKVIDGIPIR